MSASAWSRLPAELRNTPQWALAGPDKAPYVASATDGKLYPISVHATGLYDFDAAVTAAQQLEGYGIGFVLRNTDPFVCVDLDVKPNTPPEVLQGYQAFIQQLDTYTEYSQSGLGVHVWAMGYIGEGARSREGVEVYSQERFIVCTGNVIVDKPIAARQEQLDHLVAAIRAGQAQAPKVAWDPVGGPEVLTDSELVERAMYAENGEKFTKLCNGNWQELAVYPSQSEADFALISMFAFYTENNEQVHRLFKMSRLGKREKATPAYINRSLRSIRQRQAAQQSIIISEDFAARQLAQQIQQAGEQDMGAIPAAIEANPVPDAEVGIAWPPGMAGAIAGFIYNSAPRPVKEVAIVATLGLLAGICGKYFTYNNTGLNLYLILIARSGVGKEALHTGISYLMDRLRLTVPGASDFVDFTDYASGPALRKVFAKNQSFVNITGEWGRKLSRLASDRPDGPMSQLRTVMTDVYQKSGPSMRVGGLGYSDSDKSTASVNSVSYSMMGETTPDTFYESLTDSMMSDGFLSRFTIVEYKGKRPAANPAPLTTPDNYLFESICGLCAQAVSLKGRMLHQPVSETEEARALLCAFDNECDQAINSTEDETIRQMWNRAHLKVCRIASLVAVADNWVSPVVRKEHAVWALEVVRSDIAIMTKRISSGDIGFDDHSRERKLMDITQEYLEAFDNSYQDRTRPGMREDGVVTRAYLQTRCARLRVFKAHRLGYTQAMDITIKNFLDSGFFAEVGPADAMAKYQYRGKCYKVLSLPNY